MPLALGATAPPIQGVDFTAGPRVLFFYKVTCPVCQMAAPKVHAFQEAYPNRISGIGQDPANKLAEFDDRFGLGFASVADTEPYEISNAYGIRVVPTLFLIGNGRTVLHSVESWDRDGFNAVSQRMANLSDRPYRPISQPEDGLPVFRPG